MKTLAHSLDLRIFNRLIAVALFLLGASTAAPLSAQVPEGYREVQINGTTYFGLEPTFRLTAFVNALDGNTLSYYHAKRDTETFVGFVNGEAIIPEEITFVPRSRYGFRMIGGKFQGSNDSSVSGYETLHEITAMPSPQESRVQLSGTKAYRYFRYLSPVGSFGNIAEFSIVGSPVVESDATTPETEPVVTTTGSADDTATGGQSTASTNGSEESSVETTSADDSAVFRTSELYGITVFGLDPAWAPGREFEKALDGDPSTYYDYAHGDRETFVGADAGRAVVPATLYFTPRSGREQRMVGGQFQGSNESMQSGYETFHVVSSAPATAGEEIALESVPAYRFYRYLAPVGSHGNIAEFGVYVAPEEPATDSGTGSTPTEEDPVDAGTSDPEPVSGDPVADDTSDRTATPEAPEGYRISELYGITVFGLDPAWAAGREFEKALDGDPNTYYDYAHGSRETFVGADAGREVVPATLYFTPRKGYAKRMIGGLFQGSNEGPYSGYETFYEVTETPAESGVQVTLESVSAYRYFRYLAPAGSYGNIAEFGIYVAPETPADDAGTTDGSSTPETGASDSGTTDPDNGSAETPTSDGTDAGTQIGIYREAVVDGLTVFGLDPAWASGREFEKALDGDPATFYDFASGDSTFVGFDAGEAGVPRTIRYTPRSGRPERMLFGRFEGSNDSPLNGYTTIHLITSTPSDSEQVVQLPGDAAYRYYRYVAPSGGYGNIAEFSIEMEVPGSGGSVSDPDTSESEPTTDTTNDMPPSGGGTEVTSPTAGSFTLDSTMKTSAGIFSPAGKLVRTLWSNVEKAAGTHAIDWDGRDDLGNLVADTTGFYAEVLVHNVTYTYNGTVGHSGPESSMRLNMFNFPYDIAISGDGAGLIALGFNERRPSLKGIDKDFNKYQVNNPNWVRAFLHVAVDDSRYYAVNSGTTLRPKPFIVAIDSADRTRRGGVGFSTGSNVGVGTNEVWHNAIVLPETELSTAIDGKKHSMDRPFGLAVEKTGNQLYASIFHRDYVRVFDKITGAVIRTIPVSDPKGLAVDAGDQNFWVISGNTVKKFSRTGGVAATTIGGLAKPLAIAVDPATGNLYVVDGGWSQQVKIYSAAGSLINTYGRLGGYKNNGPAVSYDKFCFWTDLESNSERSFIHVTSEGSIYIGDTGNFRILVFDRGFNLLREEHLMPHNYYATVDQNDPTRVYTNGLEYSVDYSQPLVLNQGWVLKRNWMGEMRRLYEDGSRNMVLKGAMTLSAGGVDRAYLVFDEDGSPWHNGHVPFETRLYEIVNDQVLRKTDVSRQPPDNTHVRQVALYKDGLRYVSRLADAVEVIEEMFLGFDGTGDPVFDAPKLLARGPSAGNSPSTSWGTSKTGLRWPSTSTGKVIFFDGKAKPSGYKGMHLGAVAEGGFAWDWQSSPSAIWDAEPKIFEGGIVHGRYLLNPDTWGRVITRDGSFHAYNFEGAGRDLQYGGNKVHAVGRNIVYGHHGEFFHPEGGEIGQSNQFLHWFDNGLFIGQFGKATYPARPNEAYRKGSAGNAFSNELIEVNGRLFLYHNDEMGNQGIFQWEITNLDSLSIVQVSL